MYHQGSGIFPHVSLPRSLRPPPRRQSAHRTPAVGARACWTSRLQLMLNAHPIRNPIYSILDCKWGVRLTVLIDECCLGWYEMAAGANSALLYGGAQRWHDLGSRFKPYLGLNPNPGALWV